VNRSVARGDAADRIRSWHAFLTKPVDQGGLGRTPAQAKGEVASLLGESPGLNPNLSHDHGTGYGTAAWRDPSPGAGRKTNLINFTKANGLDYRTVEGQQAYYRSEMLGAYSKVNQQIMAARTPQQVTDIHVRQFERPKYQDKEAVGRTTHYGSIDAALGGQREVGTGPDSAGRGATAGPGLDPSLKPPPAAPGTAPSIGGTGILAAPRPDVQAPTAPAPSSFQDSGGRQIKGLIIHHTADDNGQVPRNVDDLKAMYAKGGLTGAHLFMDRQGNVSQTMDFGRAGQHIRNGQGPGVGLSNANTIGIEIAAKDDSDITPEQREAMKRLYPQIQAQIPGIKPFAHGEINPHKQATEGATVIGDLRSLGQSLPKPGEDVPLPPRRPDDLASGDQPLTLNVTPSGTESTQDPDFANVTPAEQASLGGDDMGGLGDIGGLLGGLDTGDAGADSGPSQLQEWDQEDRQPDRPILSEEDKQAGSPLSGDNSLLADQGQGRVDLSRVFSPEGFGGSGLLGRDQAPETTGFKAPVGLPQGGQTVGPMGVVPAAGGILSGAPSGIASITPRQLKSIAPAPAAPLPPPRPSNDALGILASPPQLDMPAIPSPEPSNLTAGILPPSRPAGLTTSALPPPRPSGIGGEVPLPPRRPEGLGTPAPATRGILAGGPAADIKFPSLVGAPTPDVASLSAPSAAAANRPSRFTSPAAGAWHSRPDLCPGGGQVNAVRLDCRHVPPHGVSEVRR
jgi:hypothetical protein